MFIFLSLCQTLKLEPFTPQWSVAKDIQDRFNANAPEYLPSTLKHMQLIEHEWQITPVVEELTTNQEYLYKFSLLLSMYML